MRANRVAKKKKKKELPKTFINWANKYIGCCGTTRDNQNHFQQADHRGSQFWVSIKLLFELI
jgi:hypothetical protein